MKTVSVLHHPLTSRKKATTQARRRVQQTQHMYQSPQTTQVAPPAYVWERIAFALDEQDRQEREHAVEHTSPF